MAAVGVTVFAAYAIASDAILQRPYSMRTTNNLIAVILLGALVGVFFRPGLAPSRELRTAGAGVLALSLAALADNLRGMGILAFRGLDLEPFGFTVLVVCLGTIAGWRILGDAQRLAAIDPELSMARQIQASIRPPEAESRPRARGRKIWDSRDERRRRLRSFEFFATLEASLESRLFKLQSDLRTGRMVPSRVAEKLSFCR